MAKIGPIFSMIFPATSTDVHPAVLNGVPLYEPFLFLYSYMYSDDVFGSSNKTISTYLGFEMGKIPANVFTFALE